MRIPFIFLVALCACCAEAQPGTLDLTFGTAGEAIIDAGSGYDLVYDMAIQPDDKIVLVGQFGGLNLSSPQDAFVIRYNADGTPDTDFGTNGQVTWTGTGGQDRLMAVAIDAQGRIVAAGETQVTGGETQMFALRLLPDGSFDNSYSGDGEATRAGSSFNDGSYARDVLCMADGGIMVFGYAHWNFSTPNINVVSFWKTTATGGSDPNVGGGSSATHTDLFNDDLPEMGNSVALRADGRFVACTTNSNAPNQRMGYATFDNNGNHLLADFENTYDLSTGNDMARSIVLMPDDRCVLAGSVGYQSALVGVMPNASYDLSFSTQGVVDVQVGSSSTAIYSAIRQPWDKVLITGGYSDGPSLGMFLGRYNADGSPDAVFGTNGFATHLPNNVGGDGRAIGIQSDGRIVVAGNTGSSGSADLFLVRYNNDIALGTAPTASTPALRAFPNPFTEALTVQGTAANGQLQVFDAMGRVVYMVRSTDGSTELHMEPRAGVYTVRYLNGNDAPHELRVVQD